MTTPRLFHHANLLSGTAENRSVCLGLKTVRFVWFQYTEALLSAVPFTIDKSEEDIRAPSAASSTPMIGVTGVCRNKLTKIQMNVRARLNNKKPHMQGITHALPQTKTDKHRGKTKDL